ncbi:unnamed protein product [Leuciscus chuanchicus]
MSAGKRSRKAAQPATSVTRPAEAQCTRPSFPSRNVVVSESSVLAETFPDGSTVTFECDIGHKPVNSRASKYVTCEGNQWTSLELECTKKSCGSPLDFHNGRYEKEGILFGDKITAVCNTGYMLDGLIKDRWCRDQGWDGRDPVCEVVKCKAPPAIVNGQFGEEPLDSYEYQQVVSYKCNNAVSSSALQRFVRCSGSGFQGLNNTILKYFFYLGSSSFTSRPVSENDSVSQLSTSSGSISAESDDTIILKKTYPGVKSNILECLAELIFSYTPYPNDAQRCAVAEALIKKNPCLKEPGSFNGLYGWQQSLKYKICEEFLRISCISLESTFMSQLDNQTPKLLSLFNAKGGAVGQRIKSQMMTLIQDPSATVEKRREVVLRCLIEYMGERQGRPHQCPPQSG